MIRNKVLNITLVSLFVLSLTTSCNQSVSLNTTNSVQTENKKNVNYNITGIAQFPENLTLTYGTKATITNIAPNATVSIIYPANHPTTPNKTIATGLTDASGNFTINPELAFNPTIGDIFILEASKRIGSVGNYVLPIRTYIKWTEQAWISMTKNFDENTYPIYINTKTTALAIIDENNTNISPSDTIGTINVSTGTSVPSDIGTPPDIFVTSGTIFSVAGLVTNVLEDNRDPLSYIIYLNNAYVYDKTFDIGKQLLANDCTGSDCDLRTFDLSYAVLKNLTLTGANLSGLNLSGIDLSGTNLTTATLTDADLSGNDLSTTTLLGADLSNANLESANLSTGITVPKIISSNTHHTNLSDAYMNGVNLYGSSVQYANLNYAYLTGGDLRNTDFSNSDMRNADISGADITNAVFNGTLLSGTKWEDGRICAPGSVTTCD